MMSIKIKLGCVPRVLIVMLSVYRCASTSFESINTFEYNWKEVENSRANAVEYSPPSTEKSEFLWMPADFGTCFGCGIRSYKELKYECVHKMPINLTVGSYVKLLTGVFKVPETVCHSRKAERPKATSVFGCGPPCSQIRLLRGQLTGCRCLKERRIAFETPLLTCQDNWNRTVSLSLCKTIYEVNPREFIAAPCDFDAVCSFPSEWILGNWTQCSISNSLFQKRDALCATRLQNGVYLIMHRSMCDNTARPEVKRSCARWTAERTFKCNCSNYNARRIVVCLRRVGHSKVRANDLDCSWHEKPINSRLCNEAERSRCRRMR